MSREQQIRDRLRIGRENRDRGWRMMLADPLMREALWELYVQCRAGRDPVYRADKDVAVNATLVNLGKQQIGDWLENRCMLADHKQWLLLQAEHDRPLDDGRAEEKRQAEDGQ